MPTALSPAKKRKVRAIYTPCISIYLPTHKKLDSNFKTRDRIKLMRLVSRIEKYLFSNSFDPVMIKNILKPVKELVENQKFWINQKESLVIFAAEDFFEFYQLDAPTELAAFIDSEFNVKLLATMMENQPRVVMTEPAVPVEPFTYQKKIA